MLHPTNLMVNSSLWLRHFYVVAINDAFKNTSLLLPTHKTNEHMCAHKYVHILCFGGSCHVGTHKNFFFKIIIIHQPSSLFSNFLPIFKCFSCSFFYVMLINHTLLWRFVRVWWDITSSFFFWHWKMGKSLVAKLIYLYKMRLSYGNIHNSLTPFVSFRWY